MENASKALIMAATGLLGLMIISVAVTLFNIFSDLGKDTIEKVENTRITEWNNTYLKYYGTTEIEDNRRKTKNSTNPNNSTRHHQSYQPRKAIQHKQLWRRPITMAWKKRKLSIRRNRNQRYQKPEPELSVGMNKTKTTF